MEKLNLQLKQSTQVLSLKTTIVLWYAEVLGVLSISSQNITKTYTKLSRFNKVNGFDCFIKDILTENGLVL